MTKHKHHEVITAWARGEIIQRKYSVNGKERWDDVGFDVIPQFLNYIEYRLKPAEPVRKYPETMMTDQETWLASAVGLNKTGEEMRRNIANAALRHAIDSGQVVMSEDEECRKPMPAGIAHLIRSYQEIDRDFLEAITSQSKFVKRKP